MRRLSFRSLRLLVSGPMMALVLLAGGCTTFNRDWKKAAREPESSDDLSGRWQGSWFSDVNGHNGALRCIITKKEDGTYKARFHATYAKTLTFGYTVTLKTEQTAPGNFKFNGEADLGWLAGGVYHYEGHSERTNFFSTYSCKYDHGTFQMSRPKE